MSEGLLYEPRSFWSIANVANEDRTYPQNVVLPREHFFNGERHPITLKRLVVASIGYGFIEPPGPLPGGGNPTGYHEGANNAAVVDVTISAPQRYHFNAKRIALGAGLTPRPRYEPRPRPNPGAPVANSRLSSLWGMSMLRCDMPLVLPQRGTIEWALSAHVPWSAAGGNEVTALALTNGFPRATMLYQEVGAGIWPGSARTNPTSDDAPFRSGFRILPLARSRVLGVPPDPEEKWPFPPDATFDPALAVETPQTSWWGPTQQFGGRAFDAQESTRSGSTLISDLRCHIDQRAYDEAMQNVFATVNQPCPLSLRTSARIKINNSGSQSWWWRPGAPLALVFDQITPATVYELPEPITLGPEDHLEVEVTVPGAFPEGEPPNRQPTAYHLGVSFNGYAAIEG